MSLHLCVCMQTIECVDKCPLTSHTETVHRADNRTETVCVPTVQ